MITYPVSTKNAAIITGISPQALRTYTRRYSRFLSLEATPDAGHRWRGESGRGNSQFQN